MSYYNRDVLGLSFRVIKYQTTAGKPQSGTVPVFWRFASVNSFLIVDDSAFSRKMIAIYVKKYFPGASVEFASDGEAGLLKFTEQRPECVFVDLLMPKMGGLDLIRCLKERGCEKIVVVSADVQKSVHADVAALGVTAFLNKPLDDKKMQKLIAALKDA